MRTINSIIRETNDEQLKQFLEVFKTPLERQIKTVKRQFNKIIDGGYQSDVKIAERGTCIKIIRKRKIVQLQIGFDDILYFYECNMENYSLFDIFCIICTHEYMHFLLGHLRFERMVSFAYYTIGSHNDFQYELKAASDLCHPLYVERHKNIRISSRQNTKEYLNQYFDHEVANIAEDIYINELINMPHPALRASDFNLPDHLTDIEYYTILMYLKNRGKELYEDKRVLLIAEYFQDAEEMLNRQLSDGQNEGDVKGEFLFGDTDDGDFQPLKESPRFGNPTQSRDMEGKRHYELFNMVYDLNRSTLQGRLSAMINKINESVGGIWYDFKQCLNQIKKSEKETKLSYTKFEADWCRFNNRKSDNILLPGRRQVKGGYNAIFEPSSIIFVDISASMEEVIKPLYTFCYMALAQMDIKLVLYDTRIQKIFDGKKDLSFMESTFGTAGGTDCLNAVREYQDLHGDIKKIYVITDGYDSTLSTLIQSNGANVWVLRNSSLKEMKI